MNIRRSFGLFISILIGGGCAAREPLRQSQEEANIVARVVESRPRGTFRITREVTADHGPSLVVTRYRIDNDAAVDVACSNATSPPCWVVGQPAIDLRKPSPTASELVALLGRLACNDITSIQTTWEQRNEWLGRVFLVRGCGASRAVRVDCSTSDPALATERCNVDSWPAVVDFDQTTHPNVRFRRCKNNVPYGVLDPSGETLDGQGLQEHVGDLGRHFKAVPTVRGVATGPCCMDDAPLTACLVVYADSRANPDTVVDAIASALGNLPSPRPHVVVDSSSRIDQRMR